MSKLTITEALQEIKTIGKRLEKKRSAIGQYVGRDFRVRDPLEKDGGSEKYIREERQAVQDLSNRVISIRTAIQRSNLDSQMTVSGKTRSVTEWLTWRREISAQEKAFLQAMTSTINKWRQDIQSKGGRIVAATVAYNEAPDASAPPQIIVNIDEKALLDEQEQVETILGELDGKLSLFNATTVIDA